MHSCPADTSSTLLKKIYAIAKTNDEIIARIILVKYERNIFVLLHSQTGKLTWWSAFLFDHRGENLEAGY